MSQAEPQADQHPAKEFAIKDCALIAIATGNRAINLRELRDNLTTTSLDSIYYHFWGGLLQPRFEEREYNNDFAAWAWYALHDAPLAERLAVIDPTRFVELEDLRQELLEIIEERLDEEEYLSWARASNRFEFIRSQIVIFDSKKRAQSPEMLAEILPELATGSIFYHFIDARRRLDDHGDDFSFWLSSHGPQHQELIRRLAAIDIYFGTLGNIKKQLIKIFDDYFEKEGV
ncbi:MAG: hypothetical protein C0613_05525 [Desulfobulbaceae bacterium]|nr:MAG: hypothetical protein C0613_05525 [Desulfobulbaceae bacterium]